MKLSNSINSSILHTLFFFNLFKHPLTKEEFFHNLWRPEQIIFADFLLKLDEMVAQKTIARTNGFYHLPNCAAQAKERITKGKIWEKKMLIAKRACQIMRFIPFVRAVFVCNTVASGTFSENSDIDVFIITKNNKIWISRLLVTFFLGIFRLRRHGRKVANRICLSFFIADNNLDLAKIAFSNEDIYLVYWINQLFPLYDPDNLRYSIEKANAWTKYNTPNKITCGTVIPKYIVKDAKISRAIKKFFEIAWSGTYGDFIEQQAKKNQTLYMSRRQPRPNPISKGVIITDSILKFHENDRRQYYYDEWKKSCGQT